MGVCRRDHVCGCGEGEERCCLEIGLAGALRRERGMERKVERVTERERTYCSDILVVQEDRVIGLRDSKS